MVLKYEIGKERNESAVLNDIAYLKRVSDLEDRSYLYRLSRKLLIEQLAVAHVALSENEFFRTQRFQQYIIMVLNRMICRCDKMH